jgi:hypothetical protein
MKNTPQINKNSSKMVQKKRSAGPPQVFDRLHQQAVRKQRDRQSIA